MTLVGTCRVSNAPSIYSFPVCSVVHHARRKCPLRGPISTSKKLPWNPRAEVRRLSHLWKHPFLGDQFSSLQNFSHHDPTDLSGRSQPTASSGNLSDGPVDKCHPECRSNCRLIKKSKSKKKHATRGHSKKQKQKRRVRWQSAVNKVVFIKKTKIANEILLTQDEATCYSFIDVKPKSVNGCSKCHLPLHVKWWSKVGGQHLEAT